MAGVGVLVAASLLGVYAVFIHDSAFQVEGETWYSLFDDAMISMRYARNLAEGEGLCWNPGEPAVEGYTNFLWTLMMGAVHLGPLPDHRTSLAVMLVGAATLLANAAVFGRLALRISGGDRTVAVAVAAGVGLYYPTIYWTLRGMEVGLVSLLVGAASLQTLRYRESGERGHSVAAGVAMALAVLTRIDALLPATIVLPFLAIGGRARREGVIAYASIVAGALALQSAFRLAYYGDPLPNTYYLKMTGIGLSVRLGRGFWAMGEIVRHNLWPLVLALVAAVVATRRSVVRPALLLPLVLFAGQCAYSVWVGGDAWEWMDYANRFLATGVPFALVVVSVSARDVASRLGTRAGLVGAAVLALLVVALDAGPVRRWREAGPFHRDNDARMAVLGRAVRDATEPGASIAVVWAGAVPYFSRRRCIDLLGKNDPVVARQPGSGRFTPGHNKWNYRHSVGVLRPDVILQTSFVWTEPGFWRFVAREGYERLDNGVFVRADSRAVDRSALAALEVADP